ncbi:hypothetical protein KVR01_000467 [Diaporthe batatas]|uniref:uncharacterized protein n=1 Tax=Diaporthe batatas TaxID=748121 RepID=UPI001D045DAD|nr:uncharacterized protein KVR01_000467 [Diaporthe batatas]KAG8169722.1 hypothetical protein KVR01_000467 [Diaporthe batatas]
MRVEDVLGRLAVMAELPNMKTSCLLAAGLGFALVAWRFWCALFKTNQLEPPVLRSYVPFIGHLWGLMRHAHDYLTSLHLQNPLPVCSLPMLGRKVYVINNPILIQAAFTNTKLSFGPFVIDFVGRMDELSASARRAYVEEGMHARVKQIFSTHMTGQPLKKMNTVLLTQLMLHLPGNGSVVEVKSLWVWLRNILTVGSTSMLLGARNNPFRTDAALVEAYWKYEAGDPSRRYNVTAVGNRSSAKNHAAMLKALTAYFSAGHDLSQHPEDADIAQMTRETTGMQREWGFTDTDLAAAQIVIIHATLVSAVPTIIWAVAHVFSRPELLATLREEALNAVTIKSDDEDPGSAKHVLVTAERIEPRCPTLVAVFRETQRLAAVGTLHRRVLEDTMISGNIEGKEVSYSLKKGVAVLMPVVPSHRNTETWGEGVDDFQPERFLSEEKIDTKGASQLRKKAYFPFGGGRELCPGRNFATAETLSTLVVLILGFDIHARDGSTFRLPPVGPSKMTSQTARPLETADMAARIKRREGWENVVWGVSTTSTM